MNSVTGESGPVSIDRPRPAISHEVPGRVEQPGPVTPPVGLQGARAPCGGVASLNRIYYIGTRLITKTHYFRRPALVWWQAFARGSGQS